MQRPVAGWGDRCHPLGWKYGVPGHELHSFPLDSNDKTATLRA